jgi:UDPglucose--hexose-1-phosphate uridylyltransferase
VIVRDELSGRQVVYAPGRAHRPGAKRGGIEPPSKQELDDCPFCGGREDRTPPETYRVVDGSGADRWLARVVPNLYPAFERQEVVVSSPRHVRSLGELTREETDAVAQAWSGRAAAARAEGFPYLHALLNEGRDAGASLPHAHTQLVWLRETPPLVAAERGLALDGELVAERDGLVLVCPRVSRLPYELLIAPAKAEGDAFASPLLPAALDLLADAVRRVHEVEGAVPLNAWLHDTGHWHLEVLPRLAVLAGIELGAGIYVNALPPPEAAARLR